MNYWRLQLHPADSGSAMAHAVKSLALGYIGLDFADPPGDLTEVQAEQIPSTQRDYWDFAHVMAPGDWVLVIAHHYPCALARVAGPYNYIRSPLEVMGTWFRHFRHVDQIHYYADFVTNPTQWRRTTMTDAISILRDRQGISYQLIEEWRSALSLTDQDAHSA